MTDLHTKFAADHAAAWAHTDKEIVCVGHDTSDDDTDHNDGDHDHA